MVNSEESQYIQTIFMHSTVCKSEPHHGLSSLEAFTSLLQNYRMPSTLDKFIPTENVYCLAYLLLWWYFSILLTVIAQCIFSALKHHNHGYHGRYTCAYDKSIIHCIDKISLIVKAVLHSCNTCSLALMQ